MTAEIEVLEKFCGRCKRIRPSGEFHKNKSKDDGLNDWCKVCKKKHRYPNAKTGEEAPMADTATKVKSKVCERCKTERDASQFHAKSSNLEDGLQPWCKPCIYSFDKSPKKDDAKDAKKDNIVTMTPPKPADVPAPVIETPRPAAATSTVPAAAPVPVAPLVDDDDDEEEEVSRDDAMDWLINQLKESKEEIERLQTMDAGWKARLDAKAAEVDELGEQAQRLENIVTGLTNELNDLQGRYDRETKRLQGDVDEAMRLYDEAQTKFKKYEDAEAEKAQKKKAEPKVSKEQKDQLALLGFKPAAK